MRPFLQLIAFMALNGLVVVGCQPPRPPLAPPEPPIVTVERPTLRDMDALAEFTGRLAAVESQEVRAQVTGYLKEVKFQEGSIIESGQLLYVIESEPYESAFANASAQVSKAKKDVLVAESQLALAQTEFTTTTKIGSSMSKEEVNRRKSTLDTAQATLGSAKAALDASLAMESKAKFDRDNCTIRSQVKGPARVGRTELTPGNFVQAGQTVLCKVTSLDPIYVYYDVDEDTSLMYRRRIFDEKSLPNPRTEKRLDCWVGLRDDVRGPNGKWPRAGTIDYIAPEIVRGLGTREIRGVLPNPGPDHRLSPGDSVRVQVTSGANEKLLTLPEIAIGSQQQQKFVYVVVQKDGKSIAEFRPVVVGPSREIDGHRLQIIKQGLTADDLVVVNGLIRVRPGAEMKPTELTTIAAKPTK